MSKKELKRFLEYLKEENLTKINPRNLSIGELNLYSQMKGFKVSVSDIVDYISDIRKKKEAELSSIEKKWITD